MSNHPTSVPREDSLKEKLVDILAYDHDIGEGSYRGQYKYDYECGCRTTLHTDNTVDGSFLLVSSRHLIESLMPFITEYGNSRELEGRIDEIDVQLPNSMGYENITPVIASNISKRIEWLESQKEKTNE